MSLLLLFQSSAGVSAALSKTEAADTVNASAVLKIKAAVSLTEQADTLGSDAKLKIAGAEAGLEAADTLASAAKLLLQANVTATEAADTLVAGTKSTIIAALGVTEASDTLSSTAGRKVTRRRRLMLPRLKTINAHLETKERRDSCNSEAVIRFNTVTMDNDWLLIAA